MEYYLLNINERINKDERENNVDYWINERGIAPIFYGQNTIEQIKNRRMTERRKDAESFVDTFYQFNDNAIILSIGNNYVYIYKQKNKIQEFEQHTHKDKTQSLVKGFYIDILGKELIKNCPLILVTIKANRHMSAGAFKRIKSENRNSSYFGNVVAMDYVITKKKQEVNNFCEYFFCLSSLELETLIAKMYEENGYYVPAYKGGFIKNFDLFCKKNGKTLALQIKLNMKNEYYSDEADTDYYYCISNDGANINNIRNWKLIKEELEKCPKTKIWLNETLNWVILKE